MREERDSPQQIMLGSRNILYCVVLGLATYFDATWLGERRQSRFIFDLKETPNKTKKYVYKTLKDEWDDPTFIKVKAGLFGTQSNRKRAFTKMWRSSISKDWAEYRGR